MQTPVIDFHTHVGGWGQLAVDDDQTTWLEVMDAAGVDKACINCIFHGDARRSNDMVAAYYSKAPDRFIQVAFVTPHYPDEAIRELERCFDVEGMAYLKVYPTYYGKQVDDPGYDPIYEWANDRGLVIMSHASYSAESDTLTQPKLFIPLAERYPDVRWVLAHAGNAPQGQDQAVAAAKACPNIYLETTTSWGYQGTIEYLVEEAGEDRVLWGSDMPLMDARLHVGRIVTASISDEAKRKVLGLNPIKLLDLDM